MADETKPSNSVKTFANSPGPGSYSPDIMYDPNKGWMEVPICRVIRPLPLRGRETHTCGGRKTVIVFSPSMYSNKEAKMEK